MVICGAFWPGRACYRARARDRSVPALRLDVAGPEAAASRACLDLVVDRDGCRTSGWSLYRASPAPEPMRREGPARRASYIPHAVHVLIWKYIFGAWVVCFL